MHAAETSSMIPVNSQEQLLDVLKHHHIDEMKFPKGVSSLWKEIHAGESVLELKNGIIRRKLSVVSICCYHTTSQGQRLRLIEEKQILKSGEVRRRPQPYVAEKVKPGEAAPIAALRGLKEELKVSGPEIVVKPIEPDPAKGLKPSSEEESKSFPGFITFYERHYFETEIPEAHYNPEGYVEETPEGTKTYFIWQKV